MAQEADFILVFEGDYLGKADSFLSLLKRNWSDKVRIRHLPSNSLEVGIRTDRFGGPDSAYMPFELNALSDDARKYSVLHFYTDVMDEAPDSPDIKLFYDIFFAACKELKPVFGTANETEEGNKRRPVTDEAEYYRNPRLFCFEPPLFDGSNFNPLQFLHDFLHTDGLIAKLAEIEKVISRSELIEIIRKYCGKVIVSDDGGVGVLKNDYPQACYPRYFLRQEVRRRGVQLEEGLAEKYAKELGIK